LYIYPEGFVRGKSKFLTPFLGLTGSLENTAKTA